MEEEPSNNELAKQVAVLEERMKTMHAEYKTDIARLAEQIARHGQEAAERDLQRNREAAERDRVAAERDLQRNREAAERDRVAAERDLERSREAAKRDLELSQEAAKRDKDNLRWNIGLWISAIIVISVLTQWLS